MRKPSRVHHSQHDNLIGYEAKVDRVGKLLHQRTTRFAMDARVGERTLHDAYEGPVNRRCEGSPKPGALLLIPAFGVEQLRLGLRPKNETWRHAPPASF